LTNNKEDFSVEIALYQALIAADVSAVVLRLPNEKTEKPDLEWLTGRILKHLRRIIRELKTPIRAFCSRFARTELRSTRWAIFSETDSRSTILATSEKPKTRESKQKTPKGQEIPIPK